jgi:hypothetical protein
VPHVAIVAAHGDFAAGLVSAVAQITGRGELLVPLSNAGCSPADIEQRLRTAGRGAVGARRVHRPAAGSCTIAARRLLRDRPDLLLVTGVNLATLVDFVCRVRPTRADGVARPARAAARADVARGVERGAGARACAPAPARSGASHGGRCATARRPLIHGQVVIGWGRPLDLASRARRRRVGGERLGAGALPMGVPPEMRVLPRRGRRRARARRYRADARAGWCSRATSARCARLVDRRARLRPAGPISAVNLGGLHHRPGRVQRMRYVFLSPDEERALRGLAGGWASTVTAQDVPSARAVPLDDVLQGRAEG